jgi:hypothetical protein
MKAGYCNIKWEAIDPIPEMVMGMGFTFRVFSL